jgi:hypothetical protein
MGMHFAILGRGLTSAMKSTFSAVQHKIFPVIFHNLLLNRAHRDCSNISALFVFAYSFIIR